MTSLRAPSWPLAAIVPGCAPGQSLMLDSSMLIRRGAWPAGQHFTAKKRSTCKVASASAVPP